MRNPTRIARISFVLISIAVLGNKVEGGEFDDLFSQGGAAQARGDYDVAISVWNAILVKSPQNAAALQSRGLAHFSTKEWAKALEDFTQAVQLDSNNANAHAGRGSAYLEQGLFDKALSDFDEAIRLNPKSGPFSRNRGRAYAAKGNYDKAIADYTDAVRFNTKDA